MQLTQSLRRNAELFPGQAALICGSRCVNWAETQRRVARLAGALCAVGARPGDRIALLAANSDRFAECLYAVAWAGCVAVPFNTRWAEAEIDFAFEDSEPALVMLDPDFAAWGPRFAARGVSVIGIGEGGRDRERKGDRYGLLEPLWPGAGATCTAHRQDHAI